LNPSDISALLIAAMFSLCVPDTFTFIIVSSFVWVTE
jgi:hypothetical protein